MNQIDWNKYKFHCSALGNLMVNSRVKSDPLSETTKTYLRELYLKEIWGRTKFDSVANKYMQKGTMCETDSLELIERVKKKKYFKNQKTFSNDYIIGTPDVVAPDLVDIKTSWDLFTFTGVDQEKGEKDYYYQLLGYMWLTGRKVAHLSYCLVNTPEELANDDLYRLSFKLPEDEAEKFRNNYVFDDIPEKMRIKTYKFGYDKTLIAELKVRILAAREYLADLVI